jgi:hypothetical protein
VGQTNAVLYSRAKDDFKLSLAMISCHFNPLTLPNQYQLLFTKLDNITPEMIIAGFGLSDYDIGLFNRYLKGGPRRHTHDNDVTDDATNNVSNSEVDDSYIEDVDFEVDEMELDSISVGYTDDSTHTSNDDEAREQEYIQMSKR